MWKAIISGVSFAVKRRRPSLPALSVFGSNPHPSPFSFISTHPNPSKHGKEDEYAIKNVAAACVAPTEKTIAREDFRKEYKVKHPNDKAVSAVAKAVGDKWKKLSDAEKAPYVAKAEKRNSEYKKNIQAYNKKQVEGPDAEEVNDDEGRDDENEEEDHKASKGKLPLKLCLTFLFEKIKRVVKEVQSLPTITTIGICWLMMLVYARYVISVATLRLMNMKESVEEGMAESMTQMESVKVELMHDLEVAKESIVAQVKAELDAAKKDNKEILKQLFRDEMQRVRSEMQRGRSDPQ